MLTCKRPETAIGRAPSSPIASQENTDLIDFAELAELAEDLRTSKQADHTSDSRRPTLLHGKTTTTLAVVHSRTLGGADSAALLASVGNDSSASIRAHDAAENPSPRPAAAPSLSSTGFPSDSQSSHVLAPQSEAEERARRCLGCGITDTPKWRCGSTLCNACGLRSAKGMRAAPMTQCALSIAGRTGAGAADGSGVCRSNGAKHGRLQAERSRHQTSSRSLTVTSATTSKTAAATASSTAASTMACAVTSTAEFTAGIIASSCNDEEQPMEEPTAAEGGGPGGYADDSMPRALPWPPFKGPVDCLPLGRLRGELSAAASAASFTLEVSAAAQSAQATLTLKQAPTRALAPASAPASASASAPASVHMSTSVQPVHHPSSPAVPEAVVGAPDNARTAKVRGGSLHSDARPGTGSAVAGDSRQANFKSCAVLRDEISMHASTVAMVAAAVPLCGDIWHSSSMNPLNHCSPVTGSTPWSHGAEATCGDGGYIADSGDGDGRYGDERRSRYSGYHCDGGCMCSYSFEGCGTYGEYGGGSCECGGSSGECGRYGFESMPYSESHTPAFVIPAGAMPDGMSPPMASAFFQTSDMMAGMSNMQASLACSHGCLPPCSASTFSTTDPFAMPITAADMQAQVVAVSQAPSSQLFSHAVPELPSPATTSMVVTSSAPSVCPMFTINAVHVPLANLAGGLPPRAAQIKPPMAELGWTHSYSTAAEVLPCAVGTTMPVYTSSSSVAPVMAAPVPSLLPIASSLSMSMGQTLCVPMGAASPRLSGGVVGAQYGAPPFTSAMVPLPLAGVSCT